jgi:PKD repeat protein
MGFARLVLCFSLVTILILAVLTFGTSAAEELEIFAGQDKTQRVEVTVEFNDARIVTPDPLPPELTYYFSWDFNANTDADLDGSTTNDPDSNTRFTENKYNIPGVYVVTLTVTDSAGGKATDTLQVTIVENQPPEISAPDSITAYVDVEQEFHVTAIDDFNPPHLLRWEWDFNDGSKSNDAPPVTHTYNSERSYHVRVRVIDQDGEYSEKIIIVNVGQPQGDHKIVFQAGVGNLSHSMKQVREWGYIAYEITGKANYCYKVDVEAVETGPPVAVLVFLSEKAFQDYTLWTAGTWDCELSDTTGRYKYIVEWQSQDNTIHFVVIDNRFLALKDPLGLYEGPATVNVTITGQWIGTPPKDGTSDQRANDGSTQRTFLILTGVIAFILLIIVIVVGMTLVKARKAR